MAIYRSMGNARRLDRLAIYILVCYSLALTILAIVSLSRKQPKVCFLEGYAVDKVPRDVPLTGVVCLRCDIGRINERVDGLLMQEVEQMYNNGISMDLPNHTRPITPYPVQRKTFHNFKF